MSPASNCAEVYSDRTYPAQYKGPKPVEEQVLALAELFRLDPSGSLRYAKNLGKLPDGAEGWFAVPSVTALAARCSPCARTVADQYCAALLLIHDGIQSSRLFQNWHPHHMKPPFLRVTERTTDAMTVISTSQKHDILIVAAQLGMRHRGRSVKRARQMFKTNEYGLTSVAVGSIILTHPTRLVQINELNLDCSGDEFAEDGITFGQVPYFNFDGDEVWFGASSAGYCSAHYGAASGFLSLETVACYSVTP